jgi:hypothetical protein
MDKHTLLTLVAIAFVSIMYGPAAALVLIIVLIAAGFLLTFLLRSIVGANLPEGLSHKTDELTLFFLYTAMTRNSTGMPQPMLQAGSGTDASANRQFMRRLKELPPFRLISNVVALLGPVVCYPAYWVLNWINAA